MGERHSGHSSRTDIFAHVRQRQRCRQGRRTVVFSASWHTTHSSSSLEALVWISSTTAATSSSGGALSFSFGTASCSSAAPPSLCNTVVASFSKGALSLSLGTAPCYSAAPPSLCFPSPKPPSSSVTMRELCACIIL